MTVIEVVSCMVVSGRPPGQGLTVAKVFGSTGTRLTSYLVLVFVVLMAADLKSETHDSTQLVQTTVGATIGMPGGLNLSTTRYVGPKLGFRLSGGYLPGQHESYMVGVQLGILWKLSERGNTLIDGSVMVGYSELEASNLADIDGYLWRYVGIAGSVKWRSLFAEGGLTVGAGTYSSPQVTLQVGFIFKTVRK